MTSPGERVAMDCELLIREVFTRNPLWDQSNPQHHNRTILDKSWDEVAEVMDSNRLAVRTKWKNLRDQFRKELKKQRKRTSGDADLETNITSWPYYKSMLFIEDQLLPGFPVGSAADSSNLKEEDPAHPQNRQSSYTKRSNYSRIIKLGERNMALIEKLRGATATFTEEEDYYFFMSLIPHTRDLPPAQKLRVRMQLQKVIFNEVYSQQLHNSQQGDSSLQSPSPHGSTSSSVANTPK